MELVRLYHDMLKKELCDILQEVEKSEQLDSQNEDLDKINAIINKYEEKYGNISKIDNHSKMDQFRVLAKKALWAACKLDANIKINTEENGLGRILWESDITVIGNGADEELKGIFVDMIIKANNIVIKSCKNDNLCRIEFIYEFYNKISL